MSANHHVQRCLHATLITSSALLGICVYAAVVPGFRSRDMSPGESAVFWSLMGLGAITAIGGAAAAWLAARSLRESLQHLDRQLREVLQKLGRDEPGPELSPSTLAVRIETLVNGIDHVLEDRRQREREVLRSDQLAMVGQIAAGVAHELRNPLTSVKMLVQTNLKEAGSRGFPTDDLEIIEQEIRRMEKCLQLFLDFARPPKPERRPTDLVALVERTLALVEGRARRQQVELRLAERPAAVVVEADEDQIQQLLLNLLLNALDAMPDGGALEVRLDEAPGGEARLHVLDSGPGIPAELFPRLFDPFVSTKETGIGLGLAVSHRIARNHGGTLSATNRAEGGTHFVLMLPLPPGGASEAPLLTRGAQHADTAGH